MMMTATRLPHGGGWAATAAHANNEIISFSLSVSLVFSEILSVCRFCLNDFYLGKIVLFFETCFKTNKWSNAKRMNESIWINDDLTLLTRRTLHWHRERWWSHLIYISIKAKKVCNCLNFILKLPTLLRDCKSADFIINASNVIIARITATLYSRTINCLFITIKKQSKRRYCVLFEFCLKTEGCLTNILLKRIIS